MSDDLQYYDYYYNTGTYNERGNKMMDDNVKLELQKKLEKKHVKQRRIAGVSLNYIEAWHAIDEANKIFGFDGWSRETIYNKEVCRYECKIGKGDWIKIGFKVGYEAKVLIRVGDVVREGTGTGSGISIDLYDAIEGAAKEAESDAMKRALMTFGYRFGLALYDKSNANVIEEGVGATILITDEQAECIKEAVTATSKSLADICKAYNISALNQLPASKYEGLMKRLIQLNLGGANANT